MYALLVTALLAAVVVPVFCVYNGDGTFHFSYSDRYNMSKGLTIVFRPKQPELYASPYFAVYLGFTTSKKHNKYNASYNLSETRYGGWTKMTWEPHGYYYYVDHLREHLFIKSDDIVVYTADIVYNGEIIYSNLWRYEHLPKDLSYCVHDSDQVNYRQYLCSQALGGRYITTTIKMTSTILSSSYNDFTSGSNIDTYLTILIVVPTVGLLALFALCACNRIHRRLRRAREVTSTESSSRFGVRSPGESLPTGARVVEQRVNVYSDRSHGGTHDSSHSTTDQPPPYTIALRSFLPSYSTIFREPHSLDPKNFSEQPPSYDLAVSNLPTAHLNTHSIEHSGNIVNDAVLR